MSRSLAIKYAKSFAKELGIEGEYGATGVDDTTAYNAFCKFMSNRGNENTGVYRNIAYELYFWHSLASVRKAEYSWGFGIRAPKEALEIMQLAHEKGSSIPKFQAQEETTHGN